LINRG